MDLLSEIRDSPAKKAVDYLEQKKEGDRVLEDLGIDILD